MNVLQLTHAVPRWIHAYRQAPWRIQRQWIGALLLGVLGLAMIASLYLDVTSQAAIAGREIQEMTNQIAAAEQSNADLQSQVAAMTSTDTMATRAKALGYQPVDPSELQYVVVPGYEAPRPAILQASVLRPSAPSIPPEYTESLLDWLGRELRTPGTGVIGALP